LAATSSEPPPVQGELAIPVEVDLGCGEEAEPERVGAVAAAYVEEGVEAVRARLEPHLTVPESPTGAGYGS
jgi:hypothetical protein